MEQSPENDLYKIKELIIKYIDLISKEFPYSKAAERLNSGEELVEFNKDNAISFFVYNGTLLLPKAAYSIFPAFEENENYGINKDSHRRVEDYLNTDTTYFDYIRHVIEGGLSVYDYFEESLLHETMHICGSDGGSPLEEGINELKTRELAQKHNIKIAAYGYPKEVEVAKQLQGVLGKDAMDELTFIPTNERYNFLVSRLGISAAELYHSLSSEMLNCSQNYYSNLRHVNNPVEKAKLYETIDYSELYTIINNHSVLK